MTKKITEDIRYVGVFDKDIDLFESQYNVPDGISYNSYIIFDEKTVIMDTVDKRASKEWLENISEQFKNHKDPDYLIVSHLEPDHSANIMEVVKKFPNMKIVLSTRAAGMITQFFRDGLSEDKLIPVKEGDCLDLGKHKLKFYMAPMVHWPEVMFTYDETEKILFSADAFGKFGNISDTEEAWLPEARRYFINICGKYGMQVQAVLKKANTLDIKTICPLHGTILKENLGYYINKYDVWSNYKPEKEGVLIVYNSIHGNTRNAVFNLIDKIKAEKVYVFDLSRDDMSEAIGYAFALEKMIIASPTYDAGLFPTTEKFMRILKHKNYQNKKVGIIENGSWAPMAGKLMKELFSEMKDIEIVDPLVTIKTTMSDETEKQFNQLIDSLNL